MKGLDFMKLRAVVASPYFGMQENYHVAIMDNEGAVSIQEVEIIEDEFNEGLTLSPFTPTVKLIDVYGAENMETIGQTLSREVQNELFLVGLKNPQKGRAPTIWLKHYKNGIFTLNEDRSDDSQSDKWSYHALCYIAWRNSKSNLDSRYVEKSDSACNQ